MRSTTAARTRDALQNYARITVLALLGALVCACGPLQSTPEPHDTTPVPRKTAPVNPVSPALPNKGPVAPEAILGLQLDDPVVVDFISANGCSVWTMSPSDNWICPLGLELNVDGNYRIDAVIYDAPGGGTAGYEGVLPGGISFSHSPEELVNKLGDPVAGRLGTNGFLKWEDGEYALFVSYLSITPLTISNVQLSIT